MTEQNMKAAICFAAAIVCLVIAARFPALFAAYMVAAILYGKDFLNWLKPDEKEGDE